MKSNTLTRIVTCFLVVTFSVGMSYAGEEEKPEKKSESPLLAPSPLQAAKSAYRSLTYRWRLLDAYGVQTPRFPLIDPYNQNPLKGDFPVIGINTFMVLTVLNQPKAAFNNQEGVDNNFNNDLIGALEFFHGNTVFKPKDWSVKGSIKTIFKRGGADVEDAGLQELFGEVKLFDVGPFYDATSARGGVQFFKTDFNGFIFQDFNLGGLLFGNLKENRYQWNLAYLKTLEKNENNLLTFETQDQEILFGNFFVQDFLRLGFNSVFSVHHHRNQLPIPDLGIANEFNVTYIGFASDGIWGRVAFNPALYLAFGTDDAFGQDISAFLAGAEFEYVNDYWIYHAAAFFASGDDDPNDGTAKGFASINENINLFGGGNSFFIGGNAFSKPNSFIPSNLGGGSQFNNPGMILLNGGVDMVLTPKLFFESNVNYMQFADTATLGIDSKSIGFEINGAINYRVFLNENLIFQAAANLFFPQDGAEQLLGNSDSILTSNLALVMLF